MRLIDTSAWIHALRPDGDSKVKERVMNLLQAGDAAWCEMVRLELWSGARGSHERKVLREMEAGLPNLEITAEVWDAAFDLARSTREKGRTITATDLLIAACARHYGVEIEHEDEHFSTLAEVR